MNNYERIKAMTIDEMAEFLMQKSYCHGCELQKGKYCPLFTCKEKRKNEIMSWLQKGSEGNNAG